MSALPQPQAAPAVLIGEDQPDVQHALRLLLKTAGCTADTADSPAAVLEAVSRRQYDIVLLDMNYQRDTTSGEEGLYILEELGKRKDAPPAIVMTAWGSINLAVQAMQKGACDFIQKPWDNRQLLQVIEKQVVRSRAERRERMLREAEMNDAAAVQQRMMPTEFPLIEGLEVSAFCRPARSVAGDYFDVFALGSQVGVCIADVVGKGMAAALLMSNLQAAVKVTVADWISPAELCRRVNDMSCRNAMPGKFITFFFAMLDRANSRLVYCNAGHNPQLLAHADGTITRLDAGGPVLGQFPNIDFQQGEVAIATGDRLVLFTDGITEAESSNGCEFGDENLETLVRSLNDRSARDIQHEIVSAVSEHCAGAFTDDATCVVVAVG